MDPNDLIDTIVDAIDYAEIAHDPQGLIKARRLLNNDLRQAIDSYVQREVEKMVTQLEFQPPEFQASLHPAAAAQGGEGGF